jgi:serine/threonine-protein kinase
MEGAEPAPPQRLGRYRLVEKLGQGGMATVYRAEDGELRRTVAIKLMHQFLADKREGAARFVREARAVAALRHPNVLQVHDYVAPDGEQPAYLVMELIRGPSLRGFVEKHGAPLAEVAACMGLKLAQALQAAHAAHIVHRDLKPENVMIDQDGRVVLCDFGIARMVDVDATMTATGGIIGSPAYMSPEQAGGEELDARSDLFSLGTVMYQLATGKLPFAAPTPLALLHKISRGEHVPPSQHNPRIPPYLERAVERCLKVAPGERWQSAADVAAALEEGLRRDGLVEVERELREYFRDPPAYNAAAEARVVTASLGQAQAALGRRELAVALAQANRVLAWREDHPDAHAIVRRIERRGALGKLGKAAALGAGALALLVGTGWSIVHFSHARKASPPPPVATVAPPVPAGKPALVSAPVEPPPVTPLPAPLKPAHPAPHPHPGKLDKNPTPAPPPVAAADPTPAPAPAPVAPAPPAPPADGTLLVTCQPYCDVSVDGVKRKLGTPLSLPPGPHSYVRDYNAIHETGTVTVEPGKQTPLERDFRALVRVEPRLRRGDAWAVEGEKPTSGEHQLKVGTHKVHLYARGQDIDHDWVAVPADGCVLVDDPKLECRKPPKP